LDAKQPRSAAKSYLRRQALDETTPVLRVMFQNAARLFRIRAGDYPQPG
jgi:hypothetical protein